MPGETLLHIGSQRRMRAQLCGLRPTCRAFRVPLRRCCPVLESATPRRRIAPQLTRDRRSRPAKATGNLPYTDVLRPKQCDLFSLRKG